MANIDLSNLTRYDGKIKEYAEDKYLSKNTANWQMTEKAGVVTCYPVPESELHPVVNFSFTETLPAEGEKGPDNPSVITGVDSITVFQNGKNLLPFKNWSMTKNGVTLTADSDGIITLNGTCTVANGSNSEMSYYGGKLHINAGQKLTLSREYISGTATAPEGQIRVDCVQTTFIDNGGSVSYNAVYNDNLNQKSTFSFQEARRIGSQTIKAVGGVVYDNYKIRVQLELGDEKTDFEAIVSKPCLVNLNGTYYGGSIDLSTGLMTVTHVFTEFDGSYTNWSWNDNNYNGTTGLNYTQGYGPTVFGAGTKNGTAKCSHFKNYATSVENVTSGYNTFPCVALTGTNGSQLQFAVPFQAKEQWMNWLVAQKQAGTPVQLIAELATPFTVQLTPTEILSLPLLDKCIPRVNTLYTDADNIQVGYQKHPARTAYELENAILALEGGE